MVLMEFVTDMVEVLEDMKRTKEHLLGHSPVSPFTSHIFSPLFTRNICLLFPTQFPLSAH